MEGFRTIERVQQVSSDGSYSIKSGVGSLVRNINGKLLPVRGILKNKNPNLHGELTNTLNDKHGDAAVGSLGEKNSEVETTKVSYARVIQSDEQKKKVNFRSLATDTSVDRVDVVIPMASVQQISERFVNTLYGYFLGKRLAYPIVENYVKTNWEKYGLMKVMMNAKGFFFFKFSTTNGMEQLMEEGPWMIRSVPLVLNIWTPSANLKKEDITSVPVWVKMQDVPIAAFSKDGLSMLATKIGRPKMVDTYTADMCSESWGRGNPLPKKDCCYTES